MGNYILRFCLRRDCAEDSVGWGIAVAEWLVCETLGAIRSICADEPSVDLSMEQWKLEGEGDSMCASLEVNGG